jgi:TATA-box binding protein (TBP) (component of TFIID and TFIIIB)
MFTKEEKEKHQEDFLEFSERTFHNNHSFHITTMTIVFQVNQPIDIQKLNNIMENNYETQFFTKQMARNKDDFRLTKRRKVVQVFFNQLSLSFTDWSKKVIKIFPNGKIHITGLASLYDFQTTHDLILSLLQEKLSVHYVSILENTKTVMTNCAIDVGRQLPLKSLAQKLAYKYPCDHHWSTSYCPEKYPALKVKYGDSSAFLFRTGKVIFSSKSLEHIMKLYNLLEISSGPIRSHKIESVHCCGYGLKAITNVVI